MFTRYAIYYTPEKGSPLAEFGADWLGWDSAFGQPRAQAQVEGIDIAAITKTPRNYGFHGTVKPPFRLAEGADAGDLGRALDDICDGAAPITLDGLDLAQMGGFLALVPVGDTMALSGLAATVVKRLDRFRAPANAAELAKRRAAHLSPAQEAHLVAWGYPYVLDQFRFHMTLTGRVDQETRSKAHAALQKRISLLNLVPYSIASLTLLGEDSSGMFHQIARHALRG